MPEVVRGQPLEIGVGVEQLLHRRLEAATALAAIAERAALRSGEHELFP